MQVGINQVVQYGKVIAYTVYDTNTCEFQEMSTFHKSYGNQLTQVDFMTLSILSSRGVVVVGKNGENFVISLGTRQLFSMTKRDLQNSRVINGSFIKDTLHLEEGDLVDLSHIFAKDTILFYGMLESNSSGSSGQSIKFVGSLKDNKQAMGVVKYPLFKDSRDIFYECLYQEIANVLDIPCCNAKMGVYAGRTCVISLFSYHIVKDYLLSFKQFMFSHRITNVSQLVGKFDFLFQENFHKQLILDYILMQEDRHMSNLSILNDQYLYLSYDNGRCLENGGIGHFSNGFRTYVERIPKEEIKKIVDIDEDKLKRIEEILRKYHVPNTTKEKVFMNIRRIL